nr:hypothetical protein [Candidatus Sigynarchaeota archaeon]
MPGRNRRRRGYPLALLLGIEKQRAMAWNVYSESIAPAFTERLQQKGSAGTANPQFNYFEAIVAKLKPIFSTGLKTLVIASPRNSTFANDFVAHLRKHHAYLMKEGSSQKIHTGTVDGEAKDVQSTLAVVKSDAFRTITASTVDQETTAIIELFDSCINNPSSLVKIGFTIDEIIQLLEALREDDENPAPEYIIMTDVFYAGHKNDPLFQRVMSIAKNIKIKTRVIQLKTEAGARVAQLGGLVCFTVPQVG